MELSASQPLPRDTPEAHGIASAAIQRWITALDTQIQEIHSVMVLRHGHVIAEAWWTPVTPDQPHLVFSLSKSVTATAIGFAIAEGLLTLDDHIGSFFPDDLPASISEGLAAMQVKHLLTMATGHATDPWPTMVERIDGNWIQAFLAAPIVTTPGTHFIYNTGATYMLSAILQQITGMTLTDYLTPRLFMPLGIESVHWQSSPQGITLGGVGLSLTTEGIARFGQLYIQHGQWQGQPLLPALWVAAATRAQIANGRDPASDWAQGYGYQFWRCRHRAYRGDGVFGQYCVVMPEQEVVLAITGGMDVFAMQRPLDLLWELLLPALHDRPLAADPAAYHALTEYLAQRQYPPIVGSAGMGAMAAIEGHRYAVDTNPLGITTIHMHATAVGGTLIVQTTTREEQIPWGNGTWQSGATMLFHQQWFDHTPTAASGAWTDDDTLTIVIRLPATPFVYTFVLVVIEAELLITIHGNVSLESTTPIVMTAQRRTSRAHSDTATSAVAPARHEIRLETHQTPRQIRHPATMARRNPPTTESPVAIVPQ
ncbi:hypothetical protein Hgul01_05263 [Herpetosiphon gulosus]|uniref:Beta-lactamase-related domain-containing protein n=2 Tax=Herpetosiphon gulosus TaxID=1973496 RepID=A0ABP9X7U3_9CHLR